ncbi:hypothetical protein KSS87_011854, partial [Heliosperma pusillum]
MQIVRDWKKDPLWSLFSPFLLFNIDILIDWCQLSRDQPQVQAESIHFNRIG